MSPPSYADQPMAAEGDRASFKLLLYFNAVQQRDFTGLQPERVLKNLDLTFVYHIHVQALASLRLGRFYR